MSLNKSRVFFLILLLFITLSPLFAYIDPGTGSLLVSTLLGVILTLAFFLKGLFYKFLHQLTGRQKGVTNDYSGKLVLFSEGKNYYTTFKPVIQSLIERGVAFVYLTADNNDPCLTEFHSPLMESACLGNIRQAITIMNHLKADTVVMTTPQLDILQLKRSSEVRHYIHLMHSPSDIHTYELFSFDCFDSILCTSQYTIDHIRELENLRNLPASNLLETGCPYYDLAPESSSSTNSNRHAVLLAPAWGERSFLKKCPHHFIQKILDAGHTLIYRPHPQSWVSDKELLDSIISSYGDNPRFIVDKEADNSASLAKAKIIICEISGIIYDFAFLQKRPVIAVELEWEQAGFESSDLVSEDASLSLLKEAGTLIKIQDLNNITDIIDQTLKKNLNEINLDNHIFNFKNAGPVAADQIISLYKGDVKS